MATLFQKNIIITINSIIYFYNSIKFSLFLTTLSLSYTHTPHQFIYHEIKPISKRFLNSTDIGKMPANLKHVHLLFHFFLMNTYGLSFRSILNSKIIYRSKWNNRKLDRNNSEWDIPNKKLLAFKQIIRKRK